MTECQEVAASIFNGLSWNEKNSIFSMKDAVALAARKMPAESHTVISNVAEELVNLSRRGNKL